MKCRWRGWGPQLALAALVISAARAPIYAGPVYSFTNITNNSATDAAIGEAQLFLEVMDLAGQVGFSFTNTGPEACSITDVYFDDGVLLSIADIVGSTGVSFSQFADPHDLPGGNNAIPPFVTTSGFSADSDPPAVPANGVNPGDELSIVFNLQSDRTYAHVLENLDSGDLRVGIHVQAFSDGGSESFINSGVIIPVPAAVLLGSIGVVLVGWLRRRRSF